ncbi:chitosanase [Terribacillus halophilus]|uniref:Chitosanase n=1 Tax=Terribacillus halophilus TaxID=361279 RepID=A0A1G6TZ73_9BACI|nr:chitosanase [Terribacillus halophilus]SDD34378.1 chitosanase [Terribacillus halophilus]
MKKRFSYVLFSLLVIFGGIYFFQCKEGNTDINTQKKNPDKTIENRYYRQIVYSFVSSAENSSTDYEEQYSYMEDIQDGRGYTAGIIGFTSGTGDLLEVVKEYQKIKPADNILVKYLSPLEAVEGSDSHEGLGAAFEEDWEKVGQTKEMMQAQDNIVDKIYLYPAIKFAEEDGLGLLGQYIYYDALVVHGPGEDPDSFNGIRKEALKVSKSPSQKGKEAEYLKAFLKTRTKIMVKEEAHQDLSRINFQEQLINQDNFELDLPIHWEMYGDEFRLSEQDIN